VAEYGSHILVKHPQFVDFFRLFPLEFQTAADKKQVCCKAHQANLPPQRIVLAKLPDYHLNAIASVAIRFNTTRHNNNACNSYRSWVNQHGLFQPQYSIF
jgi:hypothetical protein